MKTLPFIVLGCFSLLILLSSCGDKAASELALETQRQFTAAQATLLRQADAFDRQSRDLQQQLAELEKALQAKETAELRARVEAIRAENERLQEAAAETRQRSLELTAELHRAITSTPPIPQNPVPATVPSLNSFRPALASHGKWLEVSDYGEIWKPKVSSNLAWRPYVDGSWAWSSQGWTWSSNEAFGQICYHYGRWIQLPRQGWVWVPGTDWAPAWVSWRTGKDCIGWAPLPPGPKQRLTTIDSNCDAELRINPGSYCFVPTRQFVRSSYTSCLLSPIQVTRLFRHTNNITHIVVIHAPRHVSHAHRGGPDRHRIEEVCRQPVREQAPPPPVRLAHLPHLTAQAITPAANRDLRTPPTLPAVLLESRNSTSPLINRSLANVPINEPRIPRPDTLPPRQAEIPSDPAPSSPTTPLVHLREMPTRRLPSSTDTRPTLARQSVSAEHSDRPSVPVPISVSVPARNRTAAIRSEPDPSAVIQTERQAASEAPSLRASPVTLPPQGPFHPTTDPAHAAAQLAIRTDGVTEAATAAENHRQWVVRAEQEQQQQQQQLALDAERQRQAQETAMQAEQQQEQEQERQRQLAAEAERQHQAQEAAMRAEQEQQRQLAMEAERVAQEAAMLAEQERQQQQQMAIEAERQRQAQEAAILAEQERQQQQQMAMEAERQRQAQEAAMRAEQELQQQQMAVETERQRQAQEAAMLAEQERQQQQMAVEAERQRQAQEAAMLAEQERQQQQQMAIEAERQRQVQEAAMRAEQERQHQQQMAMEAERHRQAQAQEAALRAEQERQRQRQPENTPQP